MNAAAITTISDIRDQKMSKEYQEVRAQMDAAKESKAAQEEISKILAANPQIGVIVRKGKQMYYTGAGENATSNIRELI